MTYFGLKTLRCVLCTAEYYLECGCIISGIDTVCGDCLTKLWNGETIDVRRNYEQRIAELEASLPPDIGPKRQAMKREIIELKRRLELILESDGGELEKQITEMKKENFSLEAILEDRNQFFPS